MWASQNIFYSMRSSVQTQAEKKKNNSVLPLQLGCVTLLGVAALPRYRGTQSYNNGACEESARSRREVAGGARSGVKLLWQSVADSKNSQLTLPKCPRKRFFYDDAADTCQSQRLPTKQHLENTEGRRSRRKTCTHLVVNRKSWITAAPYFFHF